MRPPLYNHRSAAADIRENARVAPDIGKAMARMSSAQVKSAQLSAAQVSAAQVSALALLVFALFWVVRPVSAQNSAEWPLTDFSISSVDKSEILSGGPPRDGIPPLDVPGFVSADEAADWLGSDEPVVAFELEGDARAYPLQILIYHEIVNDTVAQTPVSVTFCPLCNASIVFDRTVDGEVLDFGTTGRLRKSDLVMYDRQTESWWQQFVGEGIIGKYTGTRLEQMPSQIISFETFRTIYPEGQILSRETGFNRPYGNNPYAGYDSIDASPFLFRGDIDKRLPPMERVLSIPGNDRHTLVPFAALDEQRIHNTRIDEQAVVVLATSNATSALDKSSIAESRKVPAAAAYSAVVEKQDLTFKLDNGDIVDEQTGSRWNALGHAVAGDLKGQRLKQIDKGVHFAFAWLAFDPTADIFGQ